jgi:hypothetical protein
MNRFSDQGGLPLAKPKAPEPQLLAVTQPMPKILERRAGRRRLMAMTHCHRMSAFGL